MTGLVTAQTNTGGVTDLLIFQQTEALYAAIVALLAVGVLSWLFGSQYHRLALTVVGLAIGIVAGWAADVHFRLNLVFLCIAVGAVVGAGLGYGLFHLWLAILTSVLLFLVFVVVYLAYIGQPYLEAAARESRLALRSQGLALPPAAGTSQPASSATRPGRPAGHAPRSSGETYLRLKAAWPRLLPSNHPDWPTWRAELRTNATETYDDLRRIMPTLWIGLILSAGIAGVCGFVLTFTRTQFVNILYTAAAGSLMIIAALAVLLTLKQTSQVRWLWNNSWAVWVLFGLMTLVGATVQYRLTPPPEPTNEDEEDDEEPAGKKPGKGKKK